jgi:uncharacterized protein
MQKTYTLPTERINILDVLRGWGIIGVVFMNITFYAEIFNETIVYPTFSTIVNYIFTIKSWTLLFVLFGYGIGESISRLNGKKVITHFLRKFGSLALISVFSILIFPNEILTDYVLIGFILLIFRNLTRRSFVIIISVLVFIIIPILHLLIQRYNIGSFELFTKILEEISTSDNFSTVIYANLKGFHRGNLLDLSYLIIVHTVMFAMGLIGLSLQKIDFFRRIIYFLPTIKRCLIYSFFIAMALLIYREVFTDFSKKIAVYYGSRYLLTFSMMTFFSTSIIILYESSYFMSFFRIISILGRISLTVYLSQNLLMLLIFTNAGLGLGKYLTFEYSMILGLLLLFLQYFLGKYWLQKYQVGPIEYLWRKMTY